MDAGPYIKDDDVWGPASSVHGLMGRVKHFLQSKKEKRSCEIYTFRTTHQWGGKKNSPKQIVHGSKFAAGGRPSTRVQSKHSGDAGKKEVAAGETLLLALNAFSLLVLFPEHLLDPTGKKKVFNDEHTAVV